MVLYVCVMERKQTILGTWTIYYTWRFWKFDSGKKHKIKPHTLHSRWTEPVMFSKIDDQLRIQNILITKNWTGNVLKDRRSVMNSEHNDNQNLRKLIWLVLSCFVQINDVIILKFSSKFLNSLFRVRLVLVERSLINYEFRT